MFAILKGIFVKVEIVLNFFPGDQSTAEKYKQFVQKLTKAHSGKDNKISIDDYFHIEDQKEWTFFIGNKHHISPWWEKSAARIVLSCIFLFGWPLRYLDHLLKWVTGMISTCFYLFQI